MSARLRGPPNGMVGLGSIDLCVLRLSQGVAVPLAEISGDSAERVRDW